MAGGAIDILVEPDLRGFTNKLGAGLQQSGRSVSGIAANLGRGLSLGLVAGTVAAAAGLAQVIRLGNEYQSNLNQLQAVTGATGAQMERVGALANELGSDLSLPATSAADAAAAMVELSKSGLSVDEAMTAARGTLQLAAAAQIDAATAAEIQGTAVNQFGLEADQAGRVADVLANTANAAAGSITDVGYALKYVGPVARSLQIDIDDTATAIGLLSNQGILGEQAGTSLRGVLASLSAPSKEAAQAIGELGIIAFDQQGRFVGLRAITEQLTAAKARMTDQEFQSAAATAFGNEGMTTANALASSGAEAFDRMAVAVRRQGGAADLAAAKTQGLGGAIDGLVSQLETFALGVYDVIDGPLEDLVRGSAQAVDRYGQSVIDGLRGAADAAGRYGPQIATSIGSLDIWRDAAEIVDNLMATLDPTADGLADVASEMFTAGGAAGILGASIELSGDALSALSSLLVPFGNLVGGLVQGFGDLPAPVQAAVLAMLAFRLARPQLEALGATVRDRVTAPFRAMGEEIRLQQALLTGSTQIMSQSVGNVGLAMAALESRVPAIGRMADAYRNVSERIRDTVGANLAIAAASATAGHSFGRLAPVVTGASNALGGLVARAGGATAALGSGLRSAVGGLVGALGGPWGLAIGAAVVGLGFLADSQAKAQQAAEQHKQQVQNLAQALRESNGVMTESIQAQRLLDAQQQSLAGTNDNLLQGYKALGVDQGVWTRALMGEQGAIGEVNRAYDALIQSHSMTERNPYTGGTSQQSLDAEGIAAQNARDQFRAFTGQVGEAEEANRAFAAAMGTTNPTILTATETGRSFAEAMGVLSKNTSDADQKVRALDQALGALAGEALTTEDAQAKLHESTDQVRQAMESAGQAAGGNLASLIGLDGAINTTTETGRRFRESLLQQRQSMADMALAARDAALAAGQDLPAANEAARVAANNARQAFVDQAIQMGLTREQADLLATHYGLIPENVVTLISQPGMTAAQQEAVLLKAKVDAVPDHKITVTQAVTAEAVKRLNELGYMVNTFPDGRTEIVADTAGAARQLNGFIDRYRNTTVYLDVRARMTSRFPGFVGPVKGLDYARGGIATAYAAGGIHRLTPMRAGLADIVPPNTWRIVGDRIRDDEAYIPINRSARSTALLEETARRMGYQLLRRYADGGIAVQARSTGGPSGAVPQVSTVSPRAIREALAGMQFALDSDGLVRLVNKENARRRGR
ncbi:phage tail tape measure protein [Saccharopolyspora taberi]|uniref:Phage tail tape measure protein domain-containing protein n=1 Tax=Saccharopolyspora taberi TaxID=60895 RepID=A0ABN3V1M0_9PSEU